MDEKDKKEILKKIKERAQAQRDTQPFTRNSGSGGSVNSKGNGMKAKGQQSKGGRGK